MHIALCSLASSVVSFCPMVLIVVSIAIHRAFLSLSPVSTAITHMNEFRRLPSLSTFLTSTGLFHWSLGITVFAFNLTFAAAALGSVADHLLVSARTGPTTCGVFLVAAHAAGMQVVALPDDGMDRSAYACAQLVIGAYADVTPEDLGL